MTYQGVADAARAQGLDVFGGFHPEPGDGTPEGTGTLCLLGPLEPGFWARVTDAPEFRDGQPDPLDRWSTRVIGDLAARLGAQPLFPFTGAPWFPFIAWARASGHAWDSPVTLLVHDRAGLMVSYRGALAFPDRLDLPPPGTRPCDTCAGQPCRAACPPGALTGAGYDVPACRTFLKTGPGQDCLSGGCQVRRACPLSAAHGRQPAQSAHHMRHFHS